MNIFVLSLNILQCAMFHCDQHVIKMILESAQMLCTVVILSGGTAGYKIAHSKHPCTLWALSSLSNWLWLRELAYALNAEFKYRYKKQEDHKSIAVIKDLTEPNIPDKGLTPFAQAMPDEFRDPDSVLAYRKYYAGAKFTFATWKGREIPEWYVELRAKMGGDAKKEVGMLLDPEYMKKKRRESKEKKVEKEEKKREREILKEKKGKKNVTEIEEKKGKKKVKGEEEEKLIEIEVRSGVMTRKMVKIQEMSNSGKRKVGNEVLVKKIKK